MANPTGVFIPDSQSLASHLALSIAPSATYADIYSRQGLANNPALTAPADHAQETTERRDSVDDMYKYVWNALRGDQQIGSFRIGGDLSVVGDVLTSLTATSTAIDIGDATTKRWGTIFATDLDLTGSIISAADRKDSVRAATTAALPANSRTGNVITADVNGALPAQDGVTLIAGQDLLLKNEAAGENNGPYDITAIGDGSNPYVLTRRPDSDTSAKVSDGMTIPVAEGTLNAELTFKLTTDDPITLNTTALVYEEVVAAFPDHGLLPGLGDDDHVIYFLADGTRSITGDTTWNSPSPLLVLGTGLGSPAIEMDKSEASADCDIRLLKGGQKYWEQSFVANEDWQLRRFIADAFQDNSIVVANATGLVSLANALDVGGDLTLDSANAAINVGDGTDSPFVLLRKGAAGVSQIQARQTLSATANDKRWLHDTDETWKAENFNGATWDTALTIDNNADVLVENQLLMAGAIAADAVATESNQVIGDGSAADHGITIHTGQDGGLNVTNTSGTTDGRGYYDTAAHTWFFETAGSAQGARITAGGVFPRNDGSASLGRVDSLAWSSLGLKERADHEYTPTAAGGEDWLRSDTPNTRLFTDDAGFDHPLSLMDPLHFDPTEFRRPNSGGATLVEDATSFVHSLRFADAITNTIYKNFELPRTYSGNGLTVRVEWTDDTGAAGNLRCTAAFERHDSGFDQNTASFSSKSFTIAGSETVGLVVINDLAFTSAEIDGMLAGENGRFRFQRLGADALDTLDGGAVDVLHVSILENP